MQIAQDKVLRDVNFDMENGVCPESMKFIVDSPNRAVLRYRVAALLEEGGGQNIAEALEGDDEEEDEEDED